MSKSLGNSLFVKDLPGNKMAFRLFLLSTHYRAPINFNMESLEQYEKDYLRLENTVKSVYRYLDLNDGLVKHEISNGEINAILNRFEDAFQQDFNTPNAITELQAIIKNINIWMRQGKDLDLLNQALYATLSMTDVLGFQFGLSPLSNENKELIHKWETARREKNFKLADDLRLEMQEKGLV